MKNGNVISLAIVLSLLMGCAAPPVPPFTTPPAPPPEWRVSAENTTECPDITGEFTLIPKVATMQLNDTWLISSGEWLDFALLLPFDRDGGETRKLNNQSEKLAKQSLVFESSDQGSVVQVRSPVINTEDFLVDIFRKNKGDFTCEAGRLVFPEFVIRGGTEGSTLSGGIYRSAALTSVGDLLFYEQLQGKKTIHTYYLFEMKKAQIH